MVHHDLLAWIRRSWDEPITQERRAQLKFAGRQQSHGFRGLPRTGALLNQTDVPALLQYTYSSFRTLVHGTLEGFFHCFHERESSRKSFRLSPAWATVCTHRHFRTDPMRFSAMRKHPAGLNTLSTSSGDLGMFQPSISYIPLKYASKIRVQQRLPLLSAVAVAS